MRINAVGPDAGTGGIGRYRLSLAEFLNGRVDYQLCQVTAGPLSRIPLLRQLPLQVKGLAAGSPVHFLHIVGCGALNFRRLPPAVATVHDLGFLAWTPESRMWTVFGRALLRVAWAGVRKCDRIIAVSDYTKESLVRLLGIEPERITRIYQGIDHTVFRPQPNARLRLQDEYGLGDWDRWKTVLMVGSELPRKNMRFALEIVSWYRDRGHHVRLLKVGSAGGATFRARTLTEVAQRALKDRVEFLDSVTDEELSLLYNAADAFICPSHLEGFSWPTVEAMACACPVVVAANAALPEVVGGGGVILDSSASPRGWAEALDRVFEDSNWTDRLRQVASQQAAKFNIYDTANATLQIYRDLSGSCLPQARQTSF